MLNMRRHDSRDRIAKPDLMRRRPTPDIPHDTRETRRVPAHIRPADQSLAGDSFQVRDVEFVRCEVHAEIVVCDAAGFLIRGL